MIPYLVTAEKTPDAENAQMELIAQMAAQLLAKHYPNYWWMVGWMPGLALCIKLRIMAPDLALQQLIDNHGFTVDCAKAGSISEIEKAVKDGGGEWLERLGLPRSAWKGDMPVALETA